jgi:hypothetical protein
MVPVRCPPVLRRPFALASGVALVVALAVTGCGRDVYVGAPAGSGGLPDGNLTAPPAAAPPARPPADTFVGSWRSAELGVAGLAGFRVVTGDLIITTLDTATWAPFDLEEVQGDLVVCGSEALENLNLSALARVGGRLRVCDAPALGSLTLSGLVEVDGDLILERVPALRVINLDLLEAAGGVGLKGIGATSLALPRLAAVGGDLALVPRGESALEAMSAPLLGAVLGNLELVAHPSLRSLSAPSLQQVGGALRIERNPLLRTLDLGDLHTVGAGGCVCDNPALPACAGEAIASLDGGVVDAEGNTGSGGCPD